MQRCTMRAAMHGKHKQGINSAKALHVLALAQRPFVTSLANPIHTASHLPGSVHPVSELLVIKVGGDLWLHQLPIIVHIAGVNLILIDVHVDGAVKL